MKFINSNPGTSASSKEAADVLKAATTAQPRFRVLGFRVLGFRVNWGEGFRV